MKGSWCLVVIAPPRETFCQKFEGFTGQNPKTSSGLLACDVNAGICLVCVSRVSKKGQSDGCWDLRCLVSVAVVSKKRQAADLEPEPAASPAEAAVGSPVQQ